MPEGFSSSLSKWRERFAVHLLPEMDSPPAIKYRRNHLLMMVVIFLLAAGVRFLHLQDRHFEIVNGQASLDGVYERYRKEAERMLEEGGLLFPNVPPREGDARLLVHPPGYAILLAAAYKISANPRPVLWVIQIICDAFAAVLVFLIADELVNRRIALIAGLFVALAPQLAYYTLILSPDSLPVLPILLAVYLIIRAIKKPALRKVMVAGLLLGLSCWLRANGLLLAPFLAATLLLLLPRVQRWRYAGTLLIAAVLVIAPITLRNYVVFKRFIPISIAAGLNLAEGIGNYDPEGKLGMPRSDREARFKDAEWNNRPDYTGSLWYPDGIERDGYRTTRALEVIRAHPGWFAAVMFRRAGSMLRYNDSIVEGWPADTSNVPIVLRSATFNHLLPLRTAEIDEEAASSGDKQTDAVLTINGGTMGEAFDTGGLVPASTLTAHDLLVGSEMLSPQTAVSFSTVDNLISVQGDGSEYADQFVTPPLTLKKQTDYLLTLTIQLEQGPAAVKVTTPDRRIALAWATLDDAVGNLSDKKQLFHLQLPFTSDDKSQVCIVVSNNGKATSHPLVKLGDAQIYELGATPFAWTRLPRAVVRPLQKSLFTTTRMIPLFGLGLVLLIFVKQFRALVLFLVVPAYYLSIHSTLSTEYRYIMGIHYFLLIFAAVSVYSLASFVLLAARQSRLWWETRPARR
jgi:hypothetical protein